MKSLIAIGLAFVLAAGCSADDEIDEEIDCGQICNRYADCIDEDYDVSECQDRCENNADADPDFARDTDDCENCLDDRSCTGATFGCAAECVAIVP